MRCGCTKKSTNLPVWNSFFWLVGKRSALRLHTRHARIVRMFPLGFSCLFAGPFLFQSVMQRRPSVCLPLLQIYTALLAQAAPPSIIDSSETTVSPYYIVLLLSCPSHPSLALAYAADRSHYCVTLCSDSTSTQIISSSHTPKHGRYNIHAGGEQPPRFRGGARAHADGSFYARPGLLRPGQQRQLLDGDHKLLPGKPALAQARHARHRGLDPGLAALLRLHVRRPREGPTRNFDVFPRARVPRGHRGHQRRGRGGKAQDVLRGLPRRLRRGGRELTAGLRSVELRGRQL